jgi:hypothetical protein
MVKRTAMASGSGQKYGPPDGWYGYAVSLTKQQQVKQFGQADGWYGYAVSLTRQQQSSVVVDGRSPDPIDSAVLAHSPVVTVVQTPAFRWDDSGIGGRPALGALLLLGMSLRLISYRNHGKPHPLATT